MHRLMATPYRALRDLMILLPSQFAKRWGGPVLGRPTLKA